MNHFDEMACMLYLEGQLDPARAGTDCAHPLGHARIAARCFTRSLRSESHCYRRP